MKIYSYAERPELEPAFHETSGQWPEFMKQDPIGESNWMELYARFPDYQMILVNDDDQALAVANCIPIHWDAPYQELPDEGWDCAFEMGIGQHAADIAPNVVSAIGITIQPALRGQGLSTRMVQAFKDRASKHGLKAVVAPVRPTMKSLYPLTAMENYVHWQDKNGAPFDAWMRVHWRLGAEYIKVAHHSMRIPGTIADWEKWTGMRFPESGAYVIPDALTPITIDCEQDQGLYIEPNVWMVHHV